MTKLQREEAQVARAAAPMRALLSELAEAAPPLIASALAHLRDHALDPGYSVTVLKRELRIRGNDLMVDFTRWVGVSPGLLIKDVRRVTAAELLRTTKMGVDTIAGWVGYADAKSLRRALDKWCEMSPSQFRRRSRRARELAGPAPVTWLSLLFWRKLYAGKLDRETVAELLAYFERLSSLPENGDAGGDGDAFLAGLAEELAATLEPWPWPEQREAARETMRFATPHFAEHLYERSHHAKLRGDLKRAAELAELALLNLEAVEELVGKPHPELRARLARVPSP